MKKTLVVMLGIAVVLPATVGLQASTLTGIYALVEKVKVAEDLSGIKVYGVFKGASQENEPTGAPIFDTPIRGWIYFKAPGDEAKKQISWIEWGDLRRIAAKNGTLSNVDMKLCIAFGSIYGEGFEPQVRGFVHDQEPSDTSLEYPVDHGMHMLATHSTVCKELQKALKKAMSQ
jgi:hypothetical protein